jgi:endonuclease-3
LILTILSQHTNDRNRDTAYRRLKKTFPNWAAVERASHAQLAEAIRATGLANQKAQAIQGALRQIRQDRGNYSLEFLKKMEMEEARQYLCSIPGVGPKTSACASRRGWA